MRAALPILAVLAATMALTLAFFLGVVRAKRRSDGEARRIPPVWFGVFAALVMAIPALGVWWLPERSLGSAALMIIAWGAGLRGTAWFAARKFIAPTLQARARDEGDATDGRDAR